jgi:predicted DNA-binding protein with PD1-like motif
MKSRLINDAPKKTWVLVFDKGDEVIANLKNFAREKNLSASQLTAIGAFSDVTLGFFVLDKKDYNHIPIREQVEVLSLVGDITSGDNGPKIHAHVVVGKIDGTAHGGHLVEAHVMPTLEVILTESPAHLHRATDPETGLALIQIEENQP